MTITLKHTTEVEKQVELPLFFIDRWEAWGFFEGNTQAKVFEGAEYKSIYTTTIDKRDLSNCIAHIPPATEEDFMERWEAAVKAMSFIPTLKEVESELPTFTKEIMIPVDTEKGEKYIPVEMTKEGDTLSWDKRKFDTPTNWVIEAEIKANPEAISNLVTV